MKLHVRFIVHISLAASLLSVAGLPSALMAQSGDVASDALESQAHATWSETMHHTSVPEKGCFHASYPNTQWEGVECAEPPVNQSALPQLKSNEQTTGNGTDYIAQAPSGHLISAASGKFPAVVGVGSEQGVGVPLFNNAGILGPNEYTLQLNTNLVHTSACGGFTNCRAWQQYLLASNAPVSLIDTSLTGNTEVYIEYWLIDYGANTSATCPLGFLPAGADATGPGVDCVQNTPAAVVYKGQLPITELAKLQLTGTATANGLDIAVVTYGNDMYIASVGDFETAISSGWTQAEFNVFGNDGGSEAVFSPGAFLEAQISLLYGSTSAPACIPPSSRAGTTGESNNLTLASCSTTGGPIPALQFTESN